MKKKINWVRITYLIGVVALIAGALDPLEGSVAIVAGNIALAFSTFLSKTDILNISINCYHDHCRCLFSFLFFFAGRFWRDINIIMVVGIIDIALSDRLVTEYYFVDH